MLHCKRLLPPAPQLTHQNSTVNPHLNIPFASQMPSKILKLQFVSNKPSLHKSHSINKIVANKLQNSDNKKCEQCEQLYPIKPIIDIKPSNQQKFFKLSAKTQILSINTSHQTLPRFLPKIHSESIRIRILQLIQLLKCHEQ